MRKLGHGIYLCRNENGFERALREYTDAEMNLPSRPQHYPCLVVLSVHLHSIIVREVAVDRLTNELELLHFAEPR